MLERFTAEPFKRPRLAGGLLLWAPVTPIRRLSVVVLGLAFSASLAVAAPPSRPARAKIDRGLREAIRSGNLTQPVIISVKPGYRDAIRQALERHGDRIVSDHEIIDALTVELHAGDVDELAQLASVDALSLDAPVAATTSIKALPMPPIATPISPAPPPIAPPPGITTTLRETLGLPKVATSSTLTGSTGIGVAIIDSGIAPSADFNGRITGFYDFTRGGANSVAPFDDFGHGTHVAGLIGSSGVSSNYEFQGIAPSVHLIGLKVLDGTGQGKTSDVIRAIEFVISHQSKLNVQIINLSLGHPILAPAGDDPLVRAVERASAAGLIVVAAAGNNGQKKSGEIGYTGITSPGNAPSAITVGAAVTNNTVRRDDDVVADFSSRGPTWFDAFAKPNVLAPGMNLASDAVLTSTLYKQMVANHVTAPNGAPLLSLSGTSMATAVTSGVVALVLDAHNRAHFHRDRDLTPNLVKGMLEYSAIPVSLADPLAQGAGVVNAAGAMALSSAIDTGAQRGDYWLRTGVPASTTFGGETAAWSQNIIWGDSVLSGDLLFVSNIVWTSNIVWDANIVWDSSLAIVRADNIVWDSAALWAANIVWADRVIGEMLGDNIVWGNATGDNIVWGSVDGDNIVWGSFAGGDNIVWGTGTGDNIVWGSSIGDNIVWGSSLGDNIVWGNAKAVGRVF